MSKNILMMYYFRFCLASLFPENTSVYASSLIDIPEKNIWDYRCEIFTGQMPLLSPNTVKAHEGVHVTEIRI